MGMDSRNVGSEDIQTHIHLTSTVQNRGQASVRIFVFRLALKRFSEPILRLFELTGPNQKPAVLNAERSLFGVQFYSSLVTVSSITLESTVCQRLRQIGVKQRISFIESNRRPETLFRSDCVTLRQSSKPQMVECFGITWIPLYMVLVDPLGLCKVTEIKKTSTQIISGIGIVRLSGHHLTKMGQGFGMTTLGQQTHAQGIAGFHIPRVMSDSKPEMPNGIVIFTEMLLKQTSH
jgi:hypothetical protein